MGNEEVVLLIYIQHAYSIERYDVLIADVVGP
jgi:hypothetical protein